MEKEKTISFFNELGTEKITMLVTSVSLFNDVATEMKKLSSNL
jgi:16S rRNA U1498 N3-methylase RsmE